MAAVALVPLVACGGDSHETRTIAILRTSPIAQESQDAFLAELDDAGWSVGDDIEVVDPDPAEVHPDAADAAAAVRGWLDDGVDLILALSTLSGSVAAEATEDVPVLVLANDPVASGIIAEPRHPEANVTGLSFRVPPDRTIEIARRVRADVDTLGFLWPSDDAGAQPVRDGLVAAAADLDVQLVDESFAGPDAAGAAVDRLAAAGADVVILANASATVRAFDAIQAATVAAGLPVVGNIESNPFAVVVLAPDLLECYRQLGRQAVRLFDGTKVADVPVEDPGDFHLLVRPSVAEKLGIEIPADLLSLADEVSD
jgi:putative ABC transport system substrate-binding protein